VRRRQVVASDGVEELPGLVLLEDGGLARADEHLADDQVVEEHPQRGDVLLDRGGGELRRELLDVGGVRTRIGFLRTLRVGVSQRRAARAVCAEAVEKDGSAEGVAERTFFTLDWLQDAELRRRSSVGLNKGEAIRRYTWRRRERPRPSTSGCGGGNSNCPECSGRNRTEGMKAVLVPKFLLPAL
jgi:hypothetical protein